MTASILGVMEHPVRAEVLGCAAVSSARLRALIWRVAGRLAHGVDARRAVAKASQHVGHGATVTEVIVCRVQDAVRSGQQSVDRCTTRSGVGPLPGHHTGLLGLGDVAYIGRFADPG